MTQKSDGQPRVIVVFDTNAYIGASTTRMEEIVAAEAAAGVLALASVWPALELLARCYHTSSKVVGRAHAALKRIVQHAGYSDATGVRLRVHEAGEFTLARGLFQRTPAEPMLETGFVANLAVAAASMPRDEFCREYADELRAVADRVRDEEDRLARMTALGLAQHPNHRSTRAAPTSLDLQIVAAGLVQTLAEQYGVALNPENSSRGVALVARNFGVAMAFVYGLISDASAASGLPGGGNSAWDLKVAFHASAGAAISGIPVLVVSDDARLRRAASEAGESARLASMPEYWELLLSPSGLAARASALLYRAETSSG